MWRPIYLEFIILILRNAVFCSVEGTIYEATEIIFPFAGSSIRGGCSARYRQ